MASRKFEKGDFVTYVNKPGCFGIYEGINLSTSAYKKMSLVLFFDPSKYTKVDDYNYDNIPNLDISIGDKRCEKTLDTEEEDYWWHKLTVSQYEAAVAKLEEYGYRWDEENLCLIDLGTGEIVKRIIVPKIEYNGEVIKPVSEDFKDKLVDFVKTKNKPTYYSYNNGNGYSNYPYWNRSEIEEWD